MIVDDDPLLIRMVQQFLRSSGYFEFVAVSDSQHAIEMINAGQPDLVLLDMMMPAVSGLEILQTRQKIESAQFIPFIV